MAISGVRGVGGGPGDTCTSWVPPRLATFRIITLVGPTQVFAALDGSQAEPPALNPPHVKVGQPLVSTVEMRGNNEGGGGMTGRRGRAARSFTGGGHILISLRAFDRVPRGNPRLMVTPPSHCIPLL